MIDLPGPVRARLLDEPAALVSGPAAALLSQVLCSPNVRTIIERLPPWARPYRAEIQATVAAIEAAAHGWHPAESALERDDATTASAAAPPFCSIETAALRLQLSQRRTQELAAAGRLGGRRVGRTWVLDASSVALEARARRATA